ncbi:cytochrome c oxidase subunit II [bacterium]|nr:cytochrome c oxidase subunit II [bacterium]
MIGPYIIPGWIAQVPLALADKTFWMPDQKSTLAGDVDWVFYLIYWISAFFLALVTAWLVLTVILYRRRKGVKEEVTPHHNLPLELTWTVIPLIIVIFIFWVGFKGYLHMVTQPGDSYEVMVTAQQWQWIFEYPNGGISEDLIVPVDMPVVLSMRSEDVIHALFVPAFRVKQDVLPGRYTKLWFEATEIGDYILVCAEYCGTKHSDMMALVRVFDREVFELEVERLNVLEGTPAEIGEILYNRMGCKQCHTTDGTASTGPTFMGIFNEEVMLQDGRKVVVEENYIRESILDPQAKLVAGYDPIMPTFKGRLSDEKITQIIAFIKSLSE